MCARQCQDIRDSVASKMVSLCLLGAYRMVRKKDINQITVHRVAYNRIEGLQGYMKAINKDAWQRPERFENVSLMM